MRQLMKRVLCIASLLFVLCGVVAVRFALYFE